MKYQEVTLASLEHPEKGSYKIGPFGSSLKKDELVEDGIPVVGIENILSNEFVPNYRKFITDEKYEQLSRYSVQSGDVLITTMGTVGRAAVVPNDVGTMIYDSHLFRMRVDPKKVFPRYLTYALNDYEGLKRQIAQRARGAIMAGLNTTILKECTIPLPPLAEQRRIAAILDLADALRAKRRAALAKLDTLLQATFLDMFGDPVSNPRGWEVDTLENVINFKTGKLDSNAMVEGGKYPFFTCAREVFEIDHYAFDCEALLMAGNNASADYWVKHYTGKFNAYQRTYVMTLNKTDLSYKYMRLAMEYKLAELKRISKGTNTRYLTLAILKPLTVQIPSKQVMNQFDRIHDQIIERQGEMEKASSQLDNLFHSLQQRAFKGEL